MFDFRRATVAYIVWDTASWSTKLLDILKIGWGHGLPGYAYVQYVRFI